MTVDEIRACLQAAGLQIASETALPNGAGTQLRARQNVVMELGMLLALLGRRNVAYLMKQQDNMERPSDVQGLLYIPFKDNVQKDAGLLLAKEMKTQGYPIALENV